MKGILKVCRIQALPFTWTPIAAGMLVAGVSDWTAFAAVMVSATVLHMGLYSDNEYVDYKKGYDTEDSSHPIPAGDVKPELALLNSGLLTLAGLLGLLNSIAFYTPRTPLHNLSLIFILVATGLVVVYNRVSKERPVMSFLLPGVVTSMFFVIFGVLFGRVLIGGGIIVFAVATSGILVGDMRDLDPKEGVSEQSTQAMLPESAIRLSGSINNSHTILIPLLGVGVFMAYSYVFFDVLLPIAALMIVALVWPVVTLNYLYGGVNEFP